MHSFNRDFVSTEYSWFAVFLYRLQLISVLCLPLSKGFSVGDKTVATGNSFISQIMVLTINTEWKKF